MELMNWLCPECGLELHKHLIEIICPVSDVDVPYAVYKLRCIHCSAFYPLHEKDCCAVLDAPEIEKGDRP